MKKKTVLDILIKLKPLLVQQFGIEQLALFGSTARDQTTANSDIDILVSFNQPATSRMYFGVQFALEDELGVAIDLVTDKALRKELRPAIEQEAIYV